VDHGVHSGKALEKLFERKLAGLGKKQWIVHPVLDFKKSVHVFAGAGDTDYVRHFGVGESGFPVMVVAGIENRIVDSDEISEVVDVHRVFLVCNTRFPAIVVLIRSAAESERILRESKKMSQSAHFLKWIYADNAVLILVRVWALGVILCSAGIDARASLWIILGAFVSKEIWCILPIYEISKALGPG
jgi:hypothetical protein